MLSRFTKLLLTFLLLVVTIKAQTTNVTLTVKPYGVTAYMVALSTTDIYDYKFTGLKNFGVGTKVYILAKETGTRGTKAKISSTATWSISRRPTNSTAAIGSIKDPQNDSSLVVYFTADSAGTYNVTFTDGSLTQTLILNAAKYLGYENTIVRGVNQNVNCKTCHNDPNEQAPSKRNLASNFESTNHATMFKRAMSATPGISGPSDHYSSSCVKCHTTGWDDNPTAKNDGFDDLPFTYPTVITTTTYNTLLTQFPNAMKRANIQCESCHGPGSGHLGNTTDERMTATFEPDVCAYCHESGTNHIISRQFRVAAHLNNGSHTGATCARCHTGKGFVQFVDNISTTDPYYDGTYYPVSCAACHDPHSAKNEYQLRTTTATTFTPNTTTPGGTPVETAVTEAGLGTICFNCHHSRQEATNQTAMVAAGTATSISPHYGSSGDILLGRNMIAQGGVTLATSGHLGETHDACVRCHMYNENRIDAKGNLILTGGHTFKMSSPDGVDNMVACEGCHGGTLGQSFADVKFFFNGTGDHDNDGIVKGLQDEVAGMIVKIKAKLPKATNGIDVASPSKTWTKAQIEAYWNYRIIEQDFSYGIHNPKYIVSGLRGAMIALGIPTAVEQLAQTIPTDYTIYQNYPNPFNPSTTIKFALPKESHVRLTIYDATGREVVTLINDQLSAGTHNVEWSAKNLASGLYLYRIEADNFVKVNKMLLLK